MANQNDVENIEFMPPSGAPPLLRFEQIQHLSYYGWLPINLPVNLQWQLQQISATAAIFFDRADDEKKTLYPQSRGTECGFYTVPAEKQYITFRHQVHNDSELEKHVRQTWQQVALLLYRILCDLTRAGGYDPGAWDYVIKDALQLPADDGGIDDNITLMRLFQYESTTGFATEHVDIGLLTLCVGGSKGLQVCDRSRSPPQWIDADGPTILAGDMARALLNNRVNAGLHRVIGNVNGRSSIVFALRSCLRGDIDLAQFGGDGIVKTRDYFYRIKGRKWNINATEEIRNEQQKAQEERRRQMQKPQGAG